jgi:hypothetical protein
VPEQVTVYVLAAVMLEAVAEPVRPQADGLNVLFTPGPVIVQEAESPEPVTVSVLLPPGRTRVGFAVTLTVGLVQLGAGQLELDGALAEHAPEHKIEPELVCPQEFAAEVQACPYHAGVAGVEAEHAPEQLIVPEFVWPQAFGAELQAVPRLPGFAGVLALHAPEQPMVPLFVYPQEFAAEVHALPYPAGFAGVEAEQAPEQLIVPEFVWPQEFAAEEHAAPRFEGFAGVVAEQLPLH